MPAASIIPDGEPVNATDAALDEFRRLMWTFHGLARSAGKIETLPASYRALATCIVTLSGLRPHLAYEGGQKDAAAIIQNLDHVRLAVDPLLEAIGAHAAASFDSVSNNPFVDLIKNALEGDPLFALRARAMERA